MESRGQATQACRPCRKLKRKCTRELPTCSLCDRLGKPCNYPIKTQSHPEDTGSLLGRVQQLERRLEEQASVSNKPRNYFGNSIFHTSGHSVHPERRQNVPSSLYLDASYFSSLPRDALDQGIPIPPEVADILSSASNIDSICAKYFSSVHYWLPMISRKRISQKLSKGISGTDASIALLICSMKLVCDVPDGPHGSSTPLYWITKGFYSLLEDSCLMSLHLLQALILISVYEIGHGIFPAGYLSLGRAARLGISFGLHDRQHATQLFKDSDTWTLKEEERRTWWATLVLDRYVNLGTNGFPLATGEPAKCELLPCLDSVWTQGGIGSNEPLFASTTAPNANVLGFAGTCRASHVLGRVIRHREEHGLDIHIKVPEAAQIHRALVALSTALQSSIASQEAEGGLDQNVSNSTETSYALCCSARLVLYNLYACNEYYGPERLGEEMEMQRQSVEGLEEVSKGIYELSKHLSGFITKDILAVSPLVGYSLYHAASECSWFVRENSDTEMATYLSKIVEVLRAFEKRWRVGGEFLKLLEADGSLATLATLAA